MTTDLRPQTLPTGVEAGRRAVSPTARAAYVRAMFGAIAPRYDLTNTVISVGLHRRWKRTTVQMLALRPGERALDLCCGTGDLARLMRAGVGPGGFVVGVDFAAPMAREARRLAAGAPVAVLMGDAMAVPFGDATFDAVAVGFGLRNVADPLHVLREIRRVLRPGGRLTILEFARIPNPVLRALYDLYALTLLAWLGRLVSRHPDAYTYLPVSVRYWVDQPGMVRLLGQVGFVRATYRNLGAGVVAVYRAEAPGN